MAKAWTIESRWFPPANIEAETRSKAIMRCYCLTKEAAGTNIKFLDFMRGLKVKPTTTEGKHDD